MLGKHLASNVFLLHCVFKLALMEILCLDKLQWRANGSLASITVKIMHFAILYVLTLYKHIQYMINTLCINQ